MKALVTVQKELLNVVAKHRLNTALKRRVPNAAYSTIRVNDKVFISCQKLVRKWAGSYCVHRFFKDCNILGLDTDDKIIIVYVDEIKLYQSNITPIKATPSTRDYKD